MKKISSVTVPALLAFLLSMGPAVAQTGGAAGGESGGASSSTGAAGGPASGAAAGGAGTGGTSSGMGAGSDTSSSTGAAGAGTGATSGAAAGAAQPGAGTRNAEAKQDDKVARADRRFIEKAAESGMFEVQAAQLAATKATDSQVKSFATQLADQHQAANQELMELARNMGVEVPAAPSRNMRRDVEKLGKKSGAEFDREFVREVGIKDHQKDIKEFEKASKDVKDPQLKAWIDKTLPALRDHLAQAQALPQAGGKSTAAMGNR